MSPEAIGGEESVSFRSDIYSLGILAYELVLGKITHGRIVLAIAPRGIQHILAKALQPGLEERYQDIADFISDVAGYFNSSELEDDRQGSDYFFALYEQLEQFQTMLLPATLPTSWKSYETGVCSLSNLGMNSLYYDFFSIGEVKKIVLISEAPAKGEEGYLHLNATDSRSSSHKKILRPLCQYKPIFF